MRAIIIEDKDAKALLDRLELEKYKKAHKHPAHQLSLDLAHGGRDEITLADMHRWFHYVVVGWLQEQGASL